MPVKYYNFNFYQSSDFVVVSFIGIRGVPQDCIIVDIQPNLLHVVINTPDFDPFEKNINLYQTIDPVTSSYQLFPSKVEIKLHKLEPINWNSLEMVALPTPNAPPTTEAAKTFNTSKWDKYVKENDEPVDTSGDNLFKILFADANPEQKRAMLKSIQQSNGKTLNMNWNEVKDNDFDEAKK